MKKFFQVSPEKLDENVFTLLKKEWMLITAGSLSSHNTMTASWGGFGHLWNRHVCTVYVRPTRFTWDFMEESDLFTLSFLGTEHREALKLCGTTSGRDTDKIADAGLTPVESPGGSVFFDEARLVIECRKIYSNVIDPERFVDRALSSHYPDMDYHTAYIGEITACLIR